MEPDVWKGRLSNGIGSINFSYAEIKYLDIYDTLILALLS